MSKSLDAPTPAQPTTATLRALAEAALGPETVPGEDDQRVGRWANELMFITPMEDFRRAVDPQTVLALLARAERAEAVANAALGLNRPEVFTASVDDVPTRNALFWKAVDEYRAALDALSGAERP